MNFAKDTSCKLASCGETVRIWDLPNYELLHEFSPVLSSYFCGVSWNADGSLVSVPAYGSTVTVTRFPPNKPAYNTEINVVENITCARFNAESTSLLLGCSSGSIVSWNIPQTKVVKTYTGHSSGVSCLHANVNNTHIASGSSNGDILVHNLVSGVYGAKLRSTNCQSVRCVRFSTVKRSFLGSSTDSGNVDFWDVNTMKLIHSFSRAHGAPATALAFSPINTLLVISAGLDKKIKAYSVNSKRTVLTLPTLFPLTSLDVLPDGRTTVVGTSQGHLMVYDLRGGRTPIRTFQAHAFSVRDLELKRFRMISKSESLGKLEVGLSLKEPLRAMSSSGRVDYNSNVNGPGEIVQPDAADTSLENAIFSPVRDAQVPEVDAKTDSGHFNSPENRHYPLLNEGDGSNNSNSYGVFSPAREDQLDSPKDSCFQNTLVPTYPTFAGTVVEDSTKILKRLLPADGIQDFLGGLNNQSSGNEHQAVHAGLSSPIQPRIEATERLSKSDTEVISRWQTSPRKFFTEGVENLVASDSSLSSHSTTDRSVTKRLSQTPVKLTEASKIKNQSSINEKTDEIPPEPNARAFQTEFLKQLLEDELEDFRVKMQQPYFSVLAQVVKNHVEMKEEIQHLKESLNIHADLWEEVKKLRAENQRLRMAF